MREIGSEFWIEKIPPASNIALVPDWIKKFGNIVLTSSGRGALSLLLDEINPKHKTALLPVYICDSVIKPFIKHGYNCYFYDIDTDLKIDLDSLQYNNIGIFLHMGYFGFDTNNNIVNYIRDLKENGAIIIEDITHTLFSDIKRYEENDYYIASLRKWFGLPSGGFVTLKESLNYNLKINSTFSDIRQEALQIKSLYMKYNDNTLKEKFLDLFKKAEEILEDDMAPYLIDQISESLLYSVNINELIEKRQANFNVLDNGLRNTCYIEPVFRNINDSICPFFYPIYIKNRERVKKELIKRNIYCPVHWPIPYNIDTMDFQYKSKFIYQNILSIPCDQRYDNKDMITIIDTIKELI